MSREQLILPNPAFIVEGHMEQKLIRSLCPGQPVNRIGCNGDAVKIDRMCEFVSTQIRALGNRNYPIIILFDREKRGESRETLRNQMLEQLALRGFGDQDIRVFIADREFEDWYLLDQDSIIRHYKLLPVRTRRTGKSGVKAIFEQMGPYNETRTGVDMFRVIDKSKVGEICGEFRSMLDLAVELNCQVI